MNTALWIVAGLLAVVFLGAGALKLVRSKDALAASGFTWVQDYSANQVRLIGIAEILGAIGLIVPPLVKIAPILAPIAADLLGGRHDRRDLHAREVQGVPPGGGDHPVRASFGIRRLGTFRPLRVLRSTTRDVMRFNRRTTTRAASQRGSCRPPG